MKTMRSTLVQQEVSYREVGRELRERMEDLNDLGYSIKNIIETVASNNIYNKQGFIIVYECDVPYARKNEPDDKSESGKWVNNKITFRFKNRDRAIEFIDKLREIIRLAGHVTVNQAFNLQSSIDERHVEHLMFNDSHLTGWTDLSSMVDDDGSYDIAIMETFIPIHYCMVTLPAPKYLKED